MKEAVGELILEIIEGVHNGITNLEYLFKQALSEFVIRSFGKDLGLIF